MNASWKTTVAGAIAALGIYFTGLDGGWHIAGQVMTAIGTFLTGLLARDHNVTSEKAGAK